MPPCPWSWTCFLTVVMLDDNIVSVSSSCLLSFGCVDLQGSDNGCLALSSVTMPETTSRIKPD